MIDYVRSHREIKDVIVSGGDPLTLPVGKLRFYLENLKAIDHVDVIRIDDLDGGPIATVMIQRKMAPRQKLCFITCLDEFVYDPATLPATNAWS